MANTPIDMLEYVLDHDYEASFMNSIAFHIDNYTIAEIVDKEWKEKDRKYKLISKVYSLNVEITDDDILTALVDKLYVTPFLSRYNDSYQIHFLVHKYPVSMKSQFEEQILQEVIQYMILKTIIALRLDNTSKIDAYIKKANQ